MSSMSFFVHRRLAFQQFSLPSFIADPSPALTRVLPSSPLTATSLTFIEPVRYRVDPSVRSYPSMSDYQPPLVAAVGALTCQLPSTPSSQPVKRRTTSSASTSTTRLSRSSSHKLRRIDEELACPPAAAATTFHSPTPRAFHVNELNHRIKNLFPDPQVLALVSMTSLCDKNPGVFFSISFSRVLVLFLRLEM